MWKYLVLGSGLAFAAVVQPGPFQAFLAARAAATGWRHTLPACISPVLSDVPIALLAVLLFGALSDVLQQLLRGAGGLFLLYLAWRALSQAQHPERSEAKNSVPRTVFEAALVNLLNPNPYLAWAFVLGPALVGAWREHAAYAVGFVAAFYGTMVPMQAGFIFLVGSSHLLGPRGRRVLIVSSAAVLAALGVYLVLAASWHLRWANLS